MNKEEKFLAYLEALKTDKNTGLMEGVIEGFKTLVEYRVNGNISERQVDIMESEDDIVNDVMDEDLELVENMDIMEEANSDIKSKIYGKNSDKARNAAYLEKEKEGVASGINDAGAKNRAAFATLNEEGGISEEDNTVTDEDSIMEVGEGIHNDKLTPELLSQIKNELNQRESVIHTELTKIPDSTYNSAQKSNYIVNMRPKLKNKVLNKYGVTELEYDNATAVTESTNNIVSKKDDITKLIDIIVEGVLSRFEVDKLN